jgi:hypothetical protein
VTQHHNLVRLADHQLAVLQRSDRVLRPTVEVEVDSAGSLLRLLVRDDDRSVRRDCRSTMDCPIRTNGRRGGAVPSTSGPSPARVCRCDGQFR